MENGNPMGRKARVVICGLVYIFLTAQSLCGVYAGQPQLPDDLSVREYFCFFGSGGIDWQALNDPNNNPILVACLKGVADESFKPPGILDVRQRLERLERGGLIKKADGRYVLAIPAIAGTKRDQLQKYAEQATVQLVPFGEEMIAQVRAQLAGRNEMVYHVLWSVIMDGGPAWDAAREEMNKRIKTGDTSTENTAWVLYPSHPFRAGTNGYNTSYGHLAITWSRNTPRPDIIGAIMSQHIGWLAQAIEQNDAIASAEVKDALGKYGLVDEAGRVRLYAVKADSQAANSYRELGTQFGRKMMTALDVNRVAGMLEVSPGIAFVIAYHEICWQLLQNLAEKKALAVPMIVAEGGTDTSKVSELVSLVILRSVSSPLPDTEMSKEEAQAIEEYRQIKARIVAGENYKDTSTPLHGGLTHLSGLGQGQTRDYFLSLDILRAPLPPAQAEEGSLWPVFAGEKELVDTFILAYSKGQWIWVGNMGANYDWRLGKPAFEKWAREKIGQSAPVARSGNPPAQEAQVPGSSTGNRVLNLDGQGDGMRVADSQSLQSFTNAITIEVWLQAASFYAEDGAVNSLVRKNLTPHAENFLLRFRNMGGSPSVQMGLGELGTLEALSEFAVNKWHHLAGTYDGRTITVLVNGVPIASQNASGRLRIDPSDLYVGKGDPRFSSGEYFHGVLDEIRIWNIARSQEQIQTAMNTPLTGKEEGLLAYWNFDDGTAKDLSGHGNDGFLIADARIVEAPRPASVAPEPEQPGKLVAWWKFENDPNDSAGANHGTVHGNPQYVDGKIGRAISFDGNDYVDLGKPDSLNFGAGDWTISVWTKTTQSGKEPQNRGTIFAYGGDEAGGIRYALAVNEEYMGTLVLTTDNDMDKVQAFGKTAVNDGNWHHVVGSRNADQLRVYVDGALDGGTNLPSSYDLSGVSQHNAYIGVITDHRDNSLFKYFVGTIDEVCIFSGAIDANGVRSLYAGQDPAKVAQTALIARAAPRPPPRQAAGVAGEGIEGDWQVVSSQAIIEVRKKPDGALAAAVVAQSSDVAAPAIPLDEVTFENGTFRFKMISNQADFEGTMKENGSSIEGQFRQQGQARGVTFRRIKSVPSEAAPVPQDQLQAQTHGTSRVATAVILVLVLAGVVAAVVLFLVRSSIRR